MRLLFHTLGRPDLDPWPRSRSYHHLLFSFFLFNDTHPSRNPGFLYHLKQPSLSNSDLFCERQHGPCLPPLPTVALSLTARSDGVDSFKRFVNGVGSRLFCPRGFLKWFSKTDKACVQCFGMSLNIPWSWELPRGENVIEADISNNVCSCISDSKTSG